MNVEEEDNVSFAKRYVLNEGINRCLLLLEIGSENIAVSALDQNRYIYKDREYYRNTAVYTEYYKMSDVSVVDGALTAGPFIKDYAVYEENRMSEFLKRMKLQEEEEIRQHEMQEKLRVQREAAETEKVAEAERKETEKAEAEKIERARAEQEKIRKRAEFEFNISHQEEPAIDEKGVRWAVCKYCGIMAPVKDFISYGGAGSINLGKCYDCRDRFDEAELPEKKADKLDRTICPECGGKLKERSGKYGTFVGCSNYPRCRYNRKKM